MTHNGVVAGSRLTDWISLGVLASSVPRDAVDEVVAAAGKGARRSDGKLPPHVMVYFAMALALFADRGGLRGGRGPVIYVGAKTGRDGIHGASMASAEFTEESKQKRPNVQVGDPFLEKLLLEACLEAMQTGAIVGIQD